MDIVHLIETQMNKSIQNQTSRTYAEIEKTLDHSEGSNTSKHSAQFNNQLGRFPLQMQNSIKRDPHTASFYHSSCN